MESIQPNQLFSYISQLGTNQSFLDTNNTPLQQLVPHHNWFNLDKGFFESKSVEELQAFNRGLVYFKAAYPNARETVDSIYQISSELIRGKSAVQVNRAATTPQDAPSLLAPEETDKGAKRTKRIEAHIEKQLHLAETYASYVGKAFLPEIEKETDRVIEAKEYLRKPAQFLTGEGFEMAMNYHLETPEVVDRVKLAHSRAQEQGKVIKSNCAEALLRSAQGFTDEPFTWIADALMSDSQ